MRPEALSNLSLRQMRAFAAVARAGSFTAAAGVRSVTGQIVSPGTRPKLE